MMSEKEERSVALLHISAENAIFMMLNCATLVHKWVKQQII